MQAELGAPIEPGFFPQGRLQITNGAGFVDFHYPVSGPNGSGTVYVVGEADDGGPWGYQEMRVQIDGGPEIDLMKAAP